ncbi:MAG: hypothetical protein K9G49_09205 [Taibaiella sp.]|nr:hypothetical protein [Taibaiella sp.]
MSFFDEQGKVTPRIKLGILCFIYIISGIIVILNSCKKAAPGDPHTTTGDCDYHAVSSIVAQKCSLSGCHNSGATFGDFTNYNALKARADNGRIRLNVFELKIMPPANADTLTAEEKETIKCWLDNDAPQN